MAALNGRDVLAGALGFTAVYFGWPFVQAQRAALAPAPKPSTAPSAVGGTDDAMSESPAGAYVPSAPGRGPTSSEGESGTFEGSDPGVVWVDPYSNDPTGYQQTEV